MTNTPLKQIIVAIGAIIVAMVIYIFEFPYIKPALIPQSAPQTKIETPQPEIATTTIKMPEIAEKILIPIIEPIKLPEQKAQAEQKPKPTPITETQTQPTQPAEILPTQQQIDSRTIVGILCTFKVEYLDPGTRAAMYTIESAYAKGSGVIIGADGRILTNRHIVENKEEATTITTSDNKQINVIEKRTLKFCDVGQVPEGTRLPTVTQIQTFNPITRIPVAGYRTEIIYIPSNNLFSEAEKYWADFAILKISGVSADGPTFGITSVPSSFPYAKVLTNATDYIKLGDQVITYGAPGNVTEGRSEDFTTMNILGSVGNITGLEIGDKFFIDTPLVIRTNMEITPGRSGSPLFWRGYVIGLTTAYMKTNVTDSLSVSMDAINKVLKTAGLGF